jgi:hypothetical protein
MMLFEAIVLHLLAGAVSGSVFRIQTLALLVGFVLVESALLGFMQGGIAAMWTAAAALIAVQVGFVAGMVARGILEHAGFPLSGIGKRPTH